MNTLQRSRTSSQSKSKDKEDNELLQSTQNLLKDVQDLLQR
jgi:hypothetical protein